MTVCSADFGDILLEKSELRDSLIEEFRDSLIEELGNSLIKKLGGSLIEEAGDSPRIGCEGMDGR